MSALVSCLSHGVWGYSELGWFFGAGTTFLSQHGAARLCPFAPASQHWALVQEMLVDKEVLCGEGAPCFLGLTSLLPLALLGWV